MRWLALTAFVALLAGCSYKVDGVGAPTPTPDPKPSEPAQSESEATSSGEKSESSAIKASDIRGVSVVIDGKTQAIGEGVVTISNGSLALTLRPKGSVSSNFNIVMLSIDHVGTGCSRSDDHFAQGLTYFPRSITQDNDDPIYSSPPSLSCGMNILELDKSRDGRVVGIYDGELKKEWGSADNARVVHAVIKFNVPMPQTQTQ